MSSAAPKANAPIDITTLAAAKDLAAWLVAMPGTAVDEELSSAFCRKFSVELTVVQHGGGAVVFGTRGALSKMCHDFGFNFSPGPRPNGERCYTRVFISRAKCAAVLRYFAAPVDLEAALRASVDAVATRKAGAK